MACLIITRGIRERRLTQHPSLRGPGRVAGRRHLLKSPCLSTGAFFLMASSRTNILLHNCAEKGPESRFPVNEHVLAIDDVISTGNDCFGWSSEFQSVRATTPFAFQYLLFPRRRFQAAPSCDTARACFSELRTRSRLHRLLVFSSYMALKVMVQRWHVLMKRQAGSI